MWLVSTYRSDVVRQLSDSHSSWQTPTQSRALADALVERGDAIVLWQVKKAFPQAQCYGIDCNIGQFGTHEMVEREGVELFNGFIQHLFVSEPIVPFDLVLMLNTYRGWESADLREHERDLPLLADAWLAKNVRYTIVTATDLQIRTWRQVAFVVARLGKGEDNSTMVCVSKSPLPRSLWQRLVPFG